MHHSSRLFLSSALLTLRLLLLFVSSFLLLPPSSPYFLYILFVLRPYILFVPECFRGSSPSRWVVDVRDPWFQPGHLSSPFQKQSSFPSH
ncbi:hypothetical protein BDV59DRAFT_171994 [Aspergillus ambiguus]|uniref:uncharacterized protein n=1 Tax=Aspergillus ambiguus TaxID=176160 RepID=UPI003CCDF1A2